LGQPQLLHPDATRQGGSFDARCRRLVEKPRRLE
jgi:hypothetical protein